MKSNIGERLNLSIQLITTRYGIIGAVETGTDESYTTRTILTQPQQIHDILFEVVEAVKQHAKKITHYPKHHDDIFEQFKLKDF